MLVPGRLRLPALLAGAWPGVLSRDGFTVTRSGTRVQLDGGVRTCVMHVHATPGGAVCDLSLVTDEIQRGRLEASLLASGAVFEDWGLITTPLRSLYRIDDEGWTPVFERWTRDGLVVNETFTPWCPGGEAFPAGDVRNGSAALPFATGPALGPDGGPARFVDLRPRAAVAASASLRSLIHRCDALLLAAGAAPIYRLGSPAPTDSARGLRP